MRLTTHANVHYSRHVDLYTFFFFFFAECGYTSPMMPFCKGWMCKAECWTEAKLLVASHGTQVHERRDQGLVLLPFLSLTNLDAIIVVEEESVEQFVILSVSFALHLCL